MAAESCAPDATRHAAVATPVLEQAAQWFALLRSGEATDADRARWQSWLTASPEHQAIWHKVERISGRLEPIATSPERLVAVNVFKTARVDTAQRRRFLLSLGAMAGSGWLGWTAWHHSPLPGLALAWMADHRTATGEIRQLVLADGTQVWLASASAFSEDYRSGLRRLQLVAGEILINTAKDTARDFVVDTPQGRLRALGTRFTVRLEANSSFVAVYEGAVEVQAGASGATTLVQAGQQTRFTEHAAEALAPADPAREAWANGILVTKDTPLGEVVAELRRYRRGHLAVAPAIAHLPVFGTYPINDPDRTLAMLETVMPIRVRRPLSWWVSIEPR